MEGRREEGCGLVAATWAVKGGTYLNVSLSRTFSDTLASAAGADGACPQLGWSIRSIAPRSNGSLASRGCYTLLPWTSLLLKRMIAYMPGGMGSGQQWTGQGWAGLGWAGWYRTGSNRSRTRTDNQMNRRKFGACLSQRPWVASSELKSFQVAQETLFLRTPPPVPRPRLGKQTCSLSQLALPTPASPTCPPLSQH